MATRETIPEYRTIQSNYVFLMEELKDGIDRIIPELFSKGVIDFTQKQRLLRKESERDNMQKVGEFLDILMYSGDGAYDAFIEAVKKHGFIQTVAKLEQDEQTRRSTANSSEDPSTDTPNGDNQEPRMPDMEIVNHLTVGNQHGNNYKDCNIFEKGSLKLTENINIKDRQSESVTFKLIKEDTDSSLKECHRNNYIKTCAFHEGLKRLTDQSIIGIIGATGDGKSVLCKIIAHQFIEENTEYVPVILTKPSEFNVIPFVEDSRFLIIIDDMFGKTVIKKNKLFKYNAIFDKIQRKIRLGQLAVIFAMREYVFKDCQYKLNQYDIFKGDSKYIHLYSEFALRTEEKRQILLHYKYSEEEVSRMITMSKDCFGFPAIASFNTSKCNTNDRQETSIYSSVTEFLLQEIHIFWQETKDIYTTLLLIFCLQPVSDEELKSESLDDIIDLKHKIQKLFKDFEMWIAIGTCSDLSQSFIQFVDKNLKKMYSLQEYVSEAFLKHFSGKQMEMVLEYCPLQLLVSMTVITHSDNARQVMINPYYYKYLSQRFLKEIKADKSDIFYHQAFLNSEFLKTLLEQDTCSSGLMQTFDKINLGKIQDSDDRGNILHYIIVYGDVKCLRQLCSNVILTSCIRSKTSSGNNCHGLSVMSRIEPLTKLQLLEAYDTTMPVDLPHMAVQSHDIEIIKYVAQKMNIETILDSNTILHSACNSDHDVIEIVDFIFLNSQIDINAQNNDGFTALHLAAKHSKIKTFTYLLSQDCLVDVQDNQGRLPLHLSVSTFTGRRVIDAAEIILVLLNSGSDLFLKDNDGHTAFDEAMRTCNPSVIELMLHYIPSVDAGVLSNAAYQLNAKLFEDILRLYLKDHSTVEPTTLFNCCLSGRDTVDKLKLLKSLDVNLNMTDDNLSSILHICCQNSSISVVKYVVEELNIDIHAKDKGGLTPLIFSTVTTIQPIEKLNYLIEKGASKYDKDDKRCNVLCVCCQHGQLDVMNYVIDELGLDWNDKDSLGNSCLFYCAVSKIHPIEKMKLLLAKGASKCDKNDKGHSLLHLSCQQGQLDVMNYVIDELGLDWKDKDSFGAHCLFYCAISEIQPIDKMKILLGKGASKYDQDDKGCSLLHVSCQNGQVEVINYLIDELCLDWKDKDSNGVPCLFYCAGSSINPIDKMKLLFVKGASKYDKGQWDSSLLHYSCQNGQLEVVSYIIDELGLDWKDTDSKVGPCLFYCAISKIHPIDKMKLLLAKGASKYDKTKGNSLLHVSSLQCQLEVMNYVIDELGLDWKDRNSDGVSCLFYCACSKINPIDKMKLLLGKGASKYDTDDTGCSLLHSSCGVGQLEVVKFVIEDLNLNVNDKNKQGVTALVYAAMSQIKPVEKLRVLSAKGVFSMTDSPNKNMALVFCSQAGSLAAVKYLVDGEGLDVNCHLPDDNITPLLAAGRSNIEKLEKIGFLISKGAQQICRPSKEYVSKEKAKLLHDGCLEGSFISVKYLVDIEGLDVNCGGPDNTTPLLSACQSNIDRLEKIGFLISKGAKIIICRPYKDYFSEEKAKLLQDCCLEGRLAAVKYFIDVDELDVNCRLPDDNITPLLAACKSNIDKLEKIWFLISRGGKIIISFPGEQYLKDYLKGEKAKLEKTEILNDYCQEARLECEKNLAYIRGLDADRLSPENLTQMFAGLTSDLENLKKTMESFNENQ